MSSKVPGKEPGSAAPGRQAGQAAVDAGLAGGDWFRSAVPRMRTKELMKRSDYPAVRDTGGPGDRGAKLAAGGADRRAAAVRRVPVLHAIYRSPVLVDIGTHPAKVIDGTVFIEVG